MQRMVYCTPFPYTDSHVVKRDDTVALI